MRGSLFPLSLEQIAVRAEYLAGERTIDALDSFVRVPQLAELRRIDGYGAAVAGAVKCPAIYYKLEDYNGGKDPSFVDCAQRWRFRGADGVGRVARTSDCIGGAAWCGGFDRKQSGVFPFYGGAVNTDSMLMDACGPRVLFHTVCEPVRGCFIVYKSGVAGHARGHIGVVLNTVPNWRGAEEKSWRQLRVFDVASRGTRRANVVSPTGWRNWRACDAFFVVRHAR